ncbi:hypothetical protein QQF64_004033 [Cirrhinus molitorella]|uniref:Uncharacterized protein n=1 Tax=Cirrhinus molitorella TaxID=172907 RepID=A0ABR3MMZ8_9TELE
MCTNCICKNRLGFGSSATAKSRDFPYQWPVQTHLERKMHCFTQPSTSYNPPLNQQVGLPNRPSSVTVGVFIVS